MDLYHNYKKYYELTKKQNELIENKDIEKLNKVITDKQEVIESIEKAPDIEEYLKNINNSKEKYEKIEKLIEKIVELEDKNTKNMQNKKQDIINDLISLNEKTKTRKGYLKNSKYEAKFIDKKS
ncbi:MAG: hypothetical protein U5K53_09000 [Halanaerobiales bacterium]|nr:hypothetical protein [Halanaerobiales bacterium]